MLKVALYDNGVWTQRYRTFDDVTALRAATAGLSSGLEVLRVVEDERPDTIDAQRAIQNDPVIENGPDAETGLRIHRLTWSVVDFSLDDAKAFKIERLQERYQSAQSKLTTLDEDEIDFRVGIMPVLNLVVRTSLPQAQQDRFVAERAKVVAYQTGFTTNRTNAQTLRAAINAATTIAEVRAVDITGGWAA